jgi:glutathione S-transferase
VPFEAERAYAHLPQIAQWVERLDQVGEGERSEMDPAAALDIARAAEPLAGTGIAAHDPIDIDAGTEVCISPTDYAEATITGTLIGTTVSSMMIRRHDPRVGDVGVHFPKIGYAITPL